MDIEENRTQAVSAQERSYEIRNLIKKIVYTKPVKESLSPELHSKLLTYYKGEIEACNHGLAESYLIDFALNKKKNKS